MPNDNIRLKKCHDTSIPQYLVTSSIVNNFGKTPTIQIIWKSSAIYVSDIICKISASGRGCHVDGIYGGGLMNADDLLLISSTYSDLCRVTICEDEMK